MKKIAVVGTGYVGQVTGVLFSDLGNDVTCIEVDERKLATLRSGRSTIYEPGLEELLRRNLEAGRLRFTDNYDEAVPNADFVFITVGTPMNYDGSADLKYVEQAATSIGKSLRKPTIIIDKSTVPVGTGDWVTDIISRNAKGVSFSVVSNPEFLREGSAVSDFVHPDRIVLGSLDRDAAERVAELHAAAGRADPDHRPAHGRDDQVRLERLPGDRISFINEIADDLRAAGRRCERSCARHGLRQAHRPALPRRRHRLRRLVLPQGRARRCPHGRNRRAATRSCCRR